MDKDSSSSSSSSHGSSAVTAAEKLLFGVDGDVGRGAGRTQMVEDVKELFKVKKKKKNTLLANGLVWVHRNFSNIHHFYSVSFRA